VSEFSASGTVDQRMSLLSDTQVRVLLREELNNNQLEVDGKSSDVTALAIINVSLGNTMSAFEDALLKIMNIDKAIDDLVALYIRDFKQPQYLFYAFLQLVILLCVALGIEVLFQRFYQQYRGNSDTDDNLLKSGRFLSLGKIAFSRLIGVAVFYGTCRLVLPYLFTQNSLFLTAHALLDYIMIARLTYVGCAFFFAPKHPRLRLFNLDDSLSRNLLNRLVIVSLFSALSIYVELFKELGIPQGLYKLGFWTNILSYVAMIVAVYLSREGIKKMLLHNDIENSERRVLFANIWPTFVITSIVLVWFTLEVVVANVGFDDDIVYAATFTMLTILAVPFFDIVLITLVDSRNPININQSNTQQQLNLSLKASILRISRIVTFMSLVFIFSLLWGIDYLSLSSQGFVAIAIARVIEAVILLLFGLISWEIVNVYIQRRLAQELPDDDSEAMDSEGGQGLSRIATLLPLIKNTIAFFIFVLSIIGALSTLGINATALLAGAGVLGLAIGFGAQTLVKDIVSGVFFLIDDAFRMGEYVVIGSTKGTVEKIALRSLRLRHHLGALHTVPYGEIPSLTNYSRDWVIMKLPFLVPHDTDINKVKKLFKALGKELLAHPDIGKDFLEPFKSQGVLSVDEVGMLIRGKFTCKPGGQFMIRKQVYLRVQQIFTENNIEFAKRKVEVLLPKDIHPELISPLSAAASESVSSPVIPPTT
jgi:small-conductance mechanosensitive channel